MHLYRDPNGRYYFRYALPLFLIEQLAFLIEQLAAHRHREVRLSLFAFHRWQAASWHKRLGWPAAKI